MIQIVRSPLRITLGGGGTDLPGWYQHHKGFLISAAINKYVYLTGSERPFDRKFWLSYSKVERVDSLAEVEHQLLARALKKYDLPNGLEVHSISEVPGGTGLGSSGSFLVGLLTLLNSMYNRPALPRDVAELASEIEMVELGKSCGKQDTYIAAHGGIITMEISRGGKIAVEQLPLQPAAVQQLQKNMLIFYSGMTRDSDMVLTDQSRRLRRTQKDALKGMRRIYEIGLESRRLLIAGQFDDFGKLMHEHWEAKKLTSSKITHPKINEAYEWAREAGALGGKIMGAGGGGYYLFYVPLARQRYFRERIGEQGLIEMDWQFDARGASVIYSV